jgi:hypothetical protein
MMLANLTPDTNNSPMKKQICCRVQDDIVSRVLLGFEYLE